MYKAHKRVDLNGSTGGAILWYRFERKHTSGVIVKANCITVTCRWTVPASGNCSKGISFHFFFLSFQREELHKANAISLHYGCGFTSNCYQYYNPSCAKSLSIAKARPKCQCYKHCHVTHVTCLPFKAHLTPFFLQCTDVFYVNLLLCSQQFS